jgi:hypothetical protein
LKTLKQHEKFCTNKSTIFVIVCGQLLGALKSKHSLTIASRINTAVRSETIQASLQLPPKTLERLTANETCLGTTQKVDGK